jgi:hypothetical protein
MVASIPGNGIPKTLLAARDTLSATKSARPKTEAEQKLDDVLTGLKSSSSSLAATMARHKIEQARVRLAGLQLAAGSAAAMGDGRLARSVAKDIRDAAREISRALSGAGAGGAGAIQPKKPEALTLNAPPVTDPKKPLSAAQSAAAQIRASLGFGPPVGIDGIAGTGEISSEDLATLKTDAAEINGALKKVMRRLLLTGMNPMLESRDRNEMYKMFGDANREIGNLQNTTKPTAGMTVNFKA